MRIAIDARLNAYRQGGISQYTRQLLTALPEAARDDEFVCLQHRDQLRPLAIAPNVSRRTALTPPHHRFEQWTLPLEVLLARPHVLHCPDFIAPIRRPCPAVVTIHDLAFMHYPEILDDSARAYYGQVKTNAPRADGIIAVSEATRQDIAQFLDLPIEQIDVIHEAAAPLYQPIELRAGEARVLNGTPVEAGSFLLFVSTLEPRKNLPTLLQALRICLDRHPDAGYRLLIVGRRGWRDEAIFSAVRDLKLGGHVLFTGGVGQYDLRWLYNACRLYINPSLYEGFGLPLLEAMACGAACLAAATSSLPEIGGNAAVYVPPLDADVWADEIVALWDDDERRAELGRLGLARARQFSWSRAARATMAVYRRAAARQPVQAVAAPAPATLFDGDWAAARPSAAHSVSPAGPRACIRCGTDLVPGALQSQLALRPATAHENGQMPAPRIWACSRCGYVELVIDWAAAVQPAEPSQPDISVGAVEAKCEQPEPVDLAPLDVPAAQTDAAETQADAVEVAAAQDAVLEAAAVPAVAADGVEVAEAQADAPETQADAVEVAVAQDAVLEAAAVPAVAVDGVEVAEAQADAAEAPEGISSPANGTAAPADDTTEHSAEAELGGSAAAAHSNATPAGAISATDPPARHSRRGARQSDSPTTTGEPAKRRQNRTKRK